MKNLSPKQLAAIQVAQVHRIAELKNLCDRYLVSPGMTAHEVFDRFISQEQGQRHEFMVRGERSKTEAKRLYWFQRATGLTTAGGQNRLKKLLSLAQPEKVVTE